MSFINLQIVARKLACMALLVSMFVPGICAGAEPSPRSFEFHLSQGIELLHQRRYREAAKEFQRALELNPTSQEARYQSALCLLATSQYEAARRELEWLEEQLPGNAQIIYHLGRLDLREGKVDDGMRRLEEIIADPPYDDAYFFLGSAFLKKNEPEKAFRWLQEATRAEPEDYRAHERLARAYFKMGRRSESEQAYARASVLRRKYLKASQQVQQCDGDLASGKGEEPPGSCQQLFDPARSDMLVTLGMLYGRHGLYGFAVDPLRRAAQLDPESYEVQYNLGLTYFRLKNYAEARNPLDKAVELRPEFFGANALLGAVLFTLREDKEARNRLSRAHRLNPEDSEVSGLLFRILILLAQKQFREKDYPAVLTHLKEAAELKPDNPQVHLLLAEVYSQLGERGNAVRESDLAEKLQWKKR